jgi:phosphoglycolate phosphatase-like HAD superfamily hydrolase
MRFDLCVLDFDGTCTLAEACGAPYLAAYKRGLGQRIGRDLERDWRAAEDRVRANPAAHGWLDRGRIVAPGNADPYIRASTVARMLLDDYGLYPEDVERRALLSELYAECYPSSLEVFRPGAREVLERLLASEVTVVVVTNSATAAVTRKIAQLLADSLVRPEVRGDARKAELREPSEPDSPFQRLPEEQRIEGLARPIYLRRGAYYGVLREIWRESATTPERTLVVGDIYELDLAMPHALGASIQLVTGETTPEYVRHHVERVERGGVASDLESVLGRIGLG